jgi:hypothetical protein
MEVRANTELTPGKIDLVSGHVNGDEKRAWCNNKRAWRGSWN